jgi:dipeptidyl aminopeptidase/acylaminoacyl peptidase
MLLKHMHVQGLACLLGISLTAGCASTPTPCPTQPEPQPPAEVAPPAAPPAPTGPLIVEGAPEVPAALRDKMLQYLEARSAGVRDISDDGKTLLVATRFGSSDQLHIVAQPLGARRQVTFGGDSVKQAAFVPGRKDAFVFARDTGGNENFQLYLGDTTAGTTVLLTDGKSRHGAFAFSRDGRQLAFTSNARNGRDMDVWLAPVADPNARRLVFERSGHWNVLGFSPDGKALLMQQFQSIERSSLHLGDLGGGTVRPLTSNYPDASFRTGAFSPDGRTLWALSDADADVVGLWTAELSADTVAWRPLTRDIPWNIEDFAIAPDGGTVVFAANEDGLSMLRTYDVKRQRIAPGPALPDTIVGGLGFARKAPVLAFTASGSTRNGDAMTFDMRTKAITRWTESEVGGLNPASFIAAETFRYDSFDGLKVPAFIYRPRGKGPHPVVINIHGGPESQSRPTFSALAQYLARESGIAVIFPNVRGSDGYGRRWLGLDNGRLREDSVRDIGALLDWVAKQPDLDASRVAVMGGSYGGYMVLASLVHFGDRLRAGIDVVGISDFVTFLENTAEYRRHLRRAEYGDESDPEMRAFLKSISPLTHVDRLRSALFVAHGANDPRVPLSEALQVAEAVKAKGREVWTMVAMNEGHGFARRENRDMWLWLSVMFLEKHLRGE